MSITFKLEIDGHSEALNVSNGNAAALLALAGLLSAPYGEIPYEQLEAAITKLLRARESGDVGHRRPEVVGRRAHRRVPAEASGRNDGSAGPCPNVRMWSHLGLSAA